MTNQNGDPVIYRCVSGGDGSPSTAGEARVEIAIPEEIL